MGGLFYGVPTIAQLKGAIRLTIEKVREDFDSDPTTCLKEYIKDLFSLQIVVEHGDTLNAGPVVIAQCEIGQITYTPTSIYKCLPGQGVGEL